MFRNNRYSRILKNVCLDQMKRRSAYSGENKLEKSQSVQRDTDMEGVMIILVQMMVGPGQLW